MPRKRIVPFGEEQIMHAMCIDDAYQVGRVLADKRHSTTELVTIEGAGPFIRKKIPAALANRNVWAALAKCESPRLPRVVATYDTPDHFVVVCDYVPGDTFEHIMASRKRLNPDEAVMLITEICEAIYDLHAHGIVHCDINPTNVIIAADGAHLIDLGIAQTIGQNADRNAAPLGTWGFAAPEQYGFAQVDAKTDVYAIARMLGYALCGIRPDDDAYETALANELIVSPALCAVVKKGAMFEPSARFQSVAELAEATQQALAGTSVPAAAPKQTHGATATAGSSPSAFPFYTPSYTQPTSPTVPSSDPSLISPSTKPQTKRKSYLTIGICAVVVILACAVSGTFWASNLSSFSPDTGEKDQPASSRQISTDSNEVTSDSSSSTVPSEASSISTPKDDSDASNPLTLVESGWSIDPTGFVIYGFGIQNTNTDRVIDFPEVKIVGRKADGTILFSDSMILGAIYPGQTLYYGGQAGNGTPPDSVDFVVQPPKKYTVNDDATEPPVFRIDNVAEIPNGFGGTDFSGEVTFLGGTPSVFASEDIAVSVILRDESGAIVFGATGYTSRPAKGETTTFEIVGGTLPTHTTVEAYAQSW